MTRLWLLTAVLLALALAACGGPDCVKYCTKLDACASQLTPPARTDVAHCLAACDAVGDSRGRVISCVIDHSCADLQAGRCTPTGGNEATQP